MVFQKTALRWGLRTAYASDESWATIIQTTSIFQHNPGYNLTIMLTMENNIPADILLPRYTASSLAL